MKLHFDLSSKFSYTVSSNLDRSSILEKLSNNIKKPSVFSFDITNTNFFEGDLYHTGFYLYRKTFGFLNSTKKLTIRGVIKKNNTGSTIDYTISRGYRFLLQLSGLPPLIIASFMVNKVLVAIIIALFSLALFLIINYSDHQSIMECNKTLERIIQKESSRENLDKQ